jgi:hypothetical protein
VGCVCALLVTILSLHFTTVWARAEEELAPIPTTQVAGILGSLAAAHKRAHRPLDPPLKQPEFLTTHTHSSGHHEPLRHLPPPSTPINTLTFIFFSAAPPPIGIEFFSLLANSESTFFTLGPVPQYIDLIRSRAASVSQFHHSCIITNCLGGHTSQHLILEELPHQHRFENVCFPQALRASLRQPTSGVCLGASPTSGLEEISVFNDDFRLSRIFHMIIDQDEGRRGSSERIPPSTK